MSYETIKCEVRDKIAYVTLNRPDKMNALNATIRTELDECFTEIEKNNDIRGIIITGEGKAFAAGADLSEINAIEDEAERSIAEEKMKRDMHKLFRKIEFLNKPVIAAVNGYALGGGFELALACDIRVAGPKAKFGLTEVKLGLVAGFGGTQRLSRVAGVGNAIELCLTGRFATADEAKAMNIVSRVAEEDVVAEATDLMNIIIKNAPLAITYNKLAVKRGFEMDIDDGLEYELAISQLAGKSEDAKEGVAAFNEKREPVYKNK